MRRPPKSSPTASSEPPDAYTTALILLGRRELSEAQRRARLTRRGCPSEAVDDVVARLRRDRTLDDGRVARAAARLEAGIRGRGRARVRQRLHALGLAADVIQQALADVYEEVDEEGLLTGALEKRLRGQPLAALDERGRARLVRALVGQGFPLSSVLRLVRP